MPATPGLIGVNGVASAALTSTRAVENGTGDAPVRRRRFPCAAANPSNSTSSISTDFDLDEMRGVARRDKALDT
jgi:hypothetical protein